MADPRPPRNRPVLAGPAGLAQRLLRRRLRPRPRPTAPPPNGAADASAAGRAPARPAAAAAPAAEEEFPWHDPALPMDERLKLAEGKPSERVLMAAMAQLDCGACGYLCQTYSEAIARGEETDLTKCTPGGKETAKKLKELVASRKACPPVAANGATPANGTRTRGQRRRQAGRGRRPRRAYDRKNPFPAPLLQCRPLNAAGLGEGRPLRRLRPQGQRADATRSATPWASSRRTTPTWSRRSSQAMGAAATSWSPRPDGGQVHSYEALVKALRHHQAQRPLRRPAGRRRPPTPRRPAPCGRCVDERPGRHPGERGTCSTCSSSSRRPGRRSPRWSPPCPPLQPRLYSISSSLKAHPDEVHLTVGVVRYTQGEPAAQGRGLDLPDRDAAAAAEGRRVRPPSPGFRLPADGDTPIIMVGPGTGIAPFRAFLEERAADRGEGQELALLRRPAPRVRLPLRGRAGGVPRSAAC